MTQKNQNQNNGMKWYHHNIMITKISLRRKILTSYQSEDHGIMQLSSLQDSSLSIARRTHCHQKNKDNWRNSLMKTFALDEYDHRHRQWHHLSFLSKRKMEHCDQHKITKSLITPQSKIAIRP